MKSDEQISEDMDQMIRTYVPEWKVEAKSESRLHRLIGTVLDEFIPYSSSFWTTIGYTSAYPDGSKDDWETRAHEGLHARQARKYTRGLFSFLYLFPQCLVPLFIVLAIAHSAWWLLPGALFALPLPAPFRGMWELDAYQISIFTMALQKAQNLDRYIDVVVSQHFAGSNYYYMFPFRSYIRKKLNQAKLAGLYWNDSHNPGYSAKFKKDPYIVDIYNVMLSSGKVKV